MRALLTAVFVLAGVPALGAEPPDDKALHAFFDRLHQEDLRESPEYATFVGVHNANDKLSDYSEAGTERRKARVKKNLAELLRFDPRKLNTQDRISREVLLDRLRRDEALNEFYRGLPFGASFTDGWMPVSPIFNLQDQFGFLVRAMPFASARDYDNYHKRLEALPGMIDRQIERMRVGMKSGWMPPKAALTKVAASFTPFAGGEPERSPLYAPLKKIPAAVGEADRERVAATIREVLASKVQPAFARLQRFIETEYIPAARNDLSASTLPGGKAYYAFMVASSTTTSLKPEAIHEIGLREVARIRGEMDKVIAQSGFKGSFEEFVKFLRTDPRFYYTRPEDLIAGYREIAKRADAELPRLFAELPRLPYGIRAMEAHQGDNADHYMGGALDGTRAGFFQANANNLAKRPKYEMESVLLHEAVPGHHLQGSRALELKGLPVFRRSGGYVAYSEGWGLYAEHLGHEMGIYSDDYSRFGALSAEMFRACRLVVDTGIHALGWDRERAIRYMAENSGMHEDFIKAEVDRYIVWPGQALGYKIGELKIKELRAKAAKALGDRFDLRRFHNALLDDGALPLTVLEARIDEWIARERSAPPRKESRP